MPVSIQLGQKNMEFQKLWDLRLLTRAEVKHEQMLVLNIWQALYLNYAKLNVASGCIMYLEWKGLTNSSFQQAQRPVWNLLVEAQPFDTNSLYPPAVPCALFLSYNPVLITVVKFVCLGAYVSMCPLHSVIRYDISSFLCNVFSEPFPRNKCQTRLAEFLSTIWVNIMLPCLCSVVMFQAISPL